MYGFQEHIEITPEQILQKVTQQEIISLVISEEFSFSRRYYSPFREDRHPDCRFEQREDGAFIFVDFGERPGKTHRSCFGLVMDYFTVSLEGAIRIICSRFGLSLNKYDYQDIPRAEYQRIEVEPVNTIINYDKKPYSKDDKLYWSQFIIKIEHLQEDNVFSIRRYSVKNRKGYRVYSGYRFCYAIDFIDKVKIYQPFNERYKWITNCDENSIGNIDNLPDTGDELIIQKSYKDHRVLRNLNLGLEVIWFPNEGCIPSMEILKNLVDRFKLITIFFDNDFGGIKAAYKLYRVLDGIRKGCARIVYLPIRCKYKDPGETIKGEGRIDTIKLLKKIGL